MEFGICDFGNVSERQTRQHWDQHLKGGTAGQGATDQGMSLGVTPAGTTGNTGADPTQALPWITSLKREV